MKGDWNAELDPIFQKDLDLEYDPRKLDGSEACTSVTDQITSRNVTGHGPFITDLPLMRPLSRQCVKIICLHVWASRTHSGL
jgi:hypothetical protein